MACLFIQIIVILFLQTFYQYYLINQLRANYSQIHFRQKKSNCAEPYLTRPKNPPLLYGPIQFRTRKTLMRAAKFSGRVGLIRRKHPTLDQFYTHLQSQSSIPSRPILKWLNPLILRALLS